MATGPRTYAEVRRVLDHPIQAVWPLIASFGGLERWAAGVVACSVQGEGPGAVRTLALGDRVARERLEAIDPDAHRLRYRILQPHALPASDVTSEISLTALDDGRTEMVWRSQAAQFEVPPEQIGARIERFYALSIDGLRRLLDQG